MVFMAPLALRIHRVLH